MFDMSCAYVHVQVVVKYEHGIPQSCNPYCIRYRSSCILALTVWLLLLRILLILIVIVVIMIIRNSKSRGRSITCANLREYFENICIYYVTVYLS
jgi:hypothetical protein